MKFLIILETSSKLNFGVYKELIYSSQFLVINLSLEATTIVPLTAIRNRLNQIVSAEE